MSNEIQIPQELVEICKELAKVARAKGLHKFEGSFEPGFDRQFEGPRWWGRIHFTWEEGRHGEDSNDIKIRTECYVSEHLTNVTLTTP